MLRIQIQCEMGVPNRLGGREGACLYWLVGRLGACLKTWSTGGDASEHEEACPDELVGCERAWQDGRVGCEEKCLNGLVSERTTRTGRSAVRGRVSAIKEA